MGIAPSEILTPRIRLRRLREGDFPAFARMNEDPEVMRYFPQVWTAEKSRAAFQWINASFDDRGFGIYAIEVGSEFAGVAGLSTPSFQSWFTPCVEILWRLRAEFWGKGCASEAAAMVLEMANHSLSLDKVFAFTVPQNLKSIRVMEKLGMMPCEPKLFDHPGVQDSNPRQHLLYSAKLRSPEAHTSKGQG
jgi:RimJ/RimL family protein N-acetyltransferase